MKFYFVPNRFVVLILLVLVLLIAVPAIAQDAPLETNTPAVIETEVVGLPPATDVPMETPTPVPPTPPEEPSNNIDWKTLTPFLGAAVIIAIVGVFYTFRLLIVQALAKQPAPAWEIEKGAAKSGLDQLEEAAKKTDTPVDDAAVAELRKAVEALQGDVDALRLQQENTARQMTQALLQAASN